MDLNLMVIQVFQNSILHTLHYIVITQTPFCVNTPSVGLCLRSSLRNTLNPKFKWYNVTIFVIVFDTVSPLTTNKRFVFYQWTISIDIQLVLSDFFFFFF